MVKINKICSIQGSSVENEDAVGSQNQYFWIIDGATDLYNSKEEIGYSVSEMEITDHRVDNLFEKGKNEIKDSIGTNSVLNKKIILQKIRKLSNQPSGYWIGSLDERFLDHAIINQIDVTSEQIVLMSDGFYEFYQNNQNKTFEELIKMRFNSSAIDPIYGKKDDASIVVIDV